MAVRQQHGQGLTAAGRAAIDLEKIEVDCLLEAVYHRYGFDFREYAPASLRVVGEARPGRPYSGAIRLGEAVAIATGAPADARHVARVALTQDSYAILMLWRLRCGARAGTCRAS